MLSQVLLAGPAVSREVLLAYALVALVSYLLGSLNFALLISRILVGDDIRKHGSGNAGMTNILRTYGKKYAVITAAGDFLKVLVAIALARYLFLREMDSVLLDAGYVAGLFVLLGHLFPLYFGFRGGKGVIVSIGVMFLTEPMVFLIMMAIFLPVVFITKIVSLASVLGAVTYPVLTFLSLYLRGMEPLYNTVFATVLGVIVLIKHRGNIKRLLNGTERRFGSGKQV